MGALSRSLIPALSLLTLVAVPACAKRIDPDRVFEVTLDVDGRMMNAVIREGGSLRLLRNAEEEYHFRPVLRNASGGTVLVAVSRGVPGQPGTQQVVERLQLLAGTPVTLRTVPTISMVLDRISRANPAETAGVPFRGAGAPR